MVCVLPKVINKILALLIKSTLGEALYRFLLSQATTSPSHRISCRGTHTEVRQRWVTGRDNDGRSQSRQETYTETVTDFDFCFDIVPNGPVTPVQWSVADDEPAYRGLMVREFESSTGTGRQVAKRKEIKSYKEWEERRKNLGLPPWVSRDDNITDGSSVHLDGLRSSKTLRQWADDYCASPKYLKEFVYKKVLFHIYSPNTFLKIKIKLVNNTTGSLWLEHATNRVCHSIYDRIVSI